MRMFLIAAIIGLIPTLSPDHWIALTLPSWLKGARRVQAAGFAFLLTLLHLVPGAVFALAAAFGLHALGATPEARQAALMVSAAMVAIVWLRRALTLDRSIALIRGFRPFGPRSGWKHAFLRAFVVIGPAEMLLPLTLRAQNLGLANASSFSMIAFALGGYALGAVIAGQASVQWAYARWDNPEWLAAKLNRTAPEAQGRARSAGSLDKAH
jgi:hypothetical protein